MTATGARLLAWLRRRCVLIVAAVAAGAFVALVTVLVVRVYEERRLRLDAFAEQAHDLCTGLNEANGSVRFILDGTLRNRQPDAPAIRPDLRQLYVDAYRQLPERNCETGERTYYDPPFPPERTNP
jgi:hypothetical protein